MFDYGPYVSLIASLVTAVVYALLAWKISGEAFDETKFLRTISLALLMALGFNVSGTPLGSIYVSPFASTVVGTLLSKYINSKADNLDNFIKSLHESQDQQPSTQQNSQPTASD